MCTCPADLQRLATAGARRREIAVHFRAMPRAHTHSMRRSRTLAAALLGGLAATPDASVAAQKRASALRAVLAATLRIARMAGGGCVLLACLGTDARPCQAQYLETVIDNTQAEFTGTWTPSTYKTGFYAIDYVFHRSGTGTNRIGWRPTLSSSGGYTVYYRLPNGASDRAPDATFTVHHATGASAVRVDEREPAGGEWRPLGTFQFLAGSSGYVDLTDAASGTYVIADAVKFVAAMPSEPLTLTEVVVDNRAAALTGSWTSSAFQPNFYGSDYLFRASGGVGANSIRWTPNLPESGRYCVYWRLPDGASNRAADAPFTVSSPAGTYVINVDERRASNGDWMPLGVFTLPAGTGSSVTLTDAATGTYLIADAIRFVRTDHVYTVRTDQRRQKIFGLGVEIQADSIGSGNVGLPDAVVAVPHDLTQSERSRFYNDMLRGFRYVRLAMGLYLRGLTADRQNIVERYPGQMADLREMIQASGMEGADVEYWSPAPSWKSSNNLIGGSLKQFDDLFLSAFGNAIVRDLDYLVASGIPVKMFGLQNEPRASYSKPYPYTTYTDQQYYDAFRHAAPLVRAAYPDVLIHNNSQAGQTGIGSALIASDAAALSYVDAWTWHRMGTDSTEQITDRLTFNSSRLNRPVFNNEFEYTSGTSVYRMVNTAQSIMNWLTFENAPTWFWLHALKPTYNSEAEGYGLGLWRPYDDDDFTKYPQISKGHFDYVKTNWHAVAGFLKYMPWNSVRIHVDEGVLHSDHRIMAWQSPAGKLAFVLTNRTTTPFTFDIGILGAPREFTGYRYDASVANTILGSVQGTGLKLTVPSYSIEFWVQK